MGDMIGSVKELSEILGVSRAYIHKLCKEKDMPHKQMKEGKVFSRSDLKAWFKDQGSIYAEKL